MSMPFLRPWLLLVVLAGLSAQVRAQTFQVFGTNVLWSYFKGTNEASLPDTKAWRNLTFNDVVWSRGLAPFYYGETITFGTVLTDMQNNYSSVFLRRQFVLTNATDIEALDINAACDDGFIAWINGVEVLRVRAPSGEPTATSLASEGAVPDPAVFVASTLPNPTNYLRAGVNVIAVQLFNVNLTSSDIVFDASLTATLKQSVPPTITLVSPVAGPVTRLTNITVTFSEPVTGVDAADLMLNEIACTAVTGSGSNYTFTCPAMPLGPVTVSWSQTAGIQDLSQPPVAFDGFGTGARWLYELYDPQAPRVASTYPADTAAVRQLTRAEVVFTREVSGVDAGDLLINGQPATNVLGAGAGPYQFEFPEPPAGLVRFTWVLHHGITDQASTPIPFVTNSWRCLLSPTLARPDVVISEIMAENVSGLADEDGDREDWIELYNRSTNAVNLAGWSLTDDPQWPRQWVFPSTNLPARSYLVVFASGKDRTVAGTGLPLHTNFKLAIDGEYLGLYSPDSLREAASEIAPKYPEQRTDYAYGLNAAGEYRYFYPGTPKATNVASAISAVVDEVHFSAGRGFYAKPFNLTLACATPGSLIRYTTNGSLPTLTNGFTYLAPIPITANKIIRAAGFRANTLPSKVGTHTYLYNQPINRRVISALSVVTATNNLYGTTGIMETNPRNTTKYGIAWERPVSVELISPFDNSGFQVDCGMRVQGGGYIRGILDYRSTAVPQGKYSFRLYFRGDYGAGRLDYPWFPETTQTSFDTIVLRAGMNDPTNPLLIDEFVRTLARDCGQPSPVGTFVHFFLNGVYKGNYNPCERIDVDFLRAYHGGDDRWDVISQMGEVREGDAGAWTTLKTLASTRDLTIRTNYLEVASRLDLTNFVDYLAPLLWADDDDWPHNNWRSARQRTGNGPFRMYVWDAEWGCGVVNGHPVSWNTIDNQLSSTSPPWGTAEIAQIFKGLKRSPEFKMLFADRVHRHLFNDGPLTDARIKARYEEVRARLNTAVSGFNNAIGTTWIPGRRRYFLDHLNRAGFLSSSNAPAFRQFGGRVARGFQLTMTNLTGTIYYSTDGTDPRVPFTGQVAAQALAYTSNTAPVLQASTWVKARSYWLTTTNTTPPATITNWSAMTEANFQVEVGGLPLRISEINYHPPGGDAYEFIELINLTPLPIDIGGVTLTGVDFRFPVGTVMAGGARLIIASDANPALFMQRYPGVTVAGWFGGSLSNGGERLSVLDREGMLITSVDYGDSGGWPTAPDGNGASLEAVNAGGDPDAAANWVASRQDGGTPGGANSPLAVGSVQINEIAAAVSTEHPAGLLTHDWVELRNMTSTDVNLAGWSLGDGGTAHRFVFPETRIPPLGFLVVHFMTNDPGFALTTGFALSAEGENLFLFDAGARRVDAVSFGLQVPGRTMGRLGAAGDWQLAEPTPGGPNEAAELGEPTSVVINEILPNPVPGGDDWIELHNRDQARPVCITGLRLASTNASQRLDALSFIAPSGFAVIHADGNAGPDHLKFKLPADRGYVALLNQLGLEMQRLNYTAALEGVSIGFLPEGGTLTRPFPYSGSPGVSNYARATFSVRLNEVLAASRTNASDWIELLNPTGAAIDLGGMSLSVDASKPGQWVFPSGVSIPSGGYLVILADGNRAASTVAGPVLNCGRSLSADGGAVYVFGAQGQLVDLVEYGFQLPDQSIGLSSSTWVLQASLTPGAANALPAALGAQTNARLNEWKAGGDGDDWLEVFNLDPLPINLGGCILTDDPSTAGQTNHLIAPLTFVGGKNWVRWIADGNADQGPDHLRFRLNVQGETLRLYLNDFTVADTVDYTVLTPGVSRGRFPDGGAAWTDFLTTASPAAPNWLRMDEVVINETLAHTDPPLDDAVEIANAGTQAVDISGWWLSNDRRDPKKFRVPAGTVLPAGGTKVYYQSDFEPVPGGVGSFKLDPDREGEVVLSQARPDGTLTGFRSVVELGASMNGVSFGRYRTSVGFEDTFLVRRTFGEDAPETLQQFHRGQGLPNAGPLVGPVIINEVMYHPVEGTNRPPESGLEFVELLNLGDTPQPLWEVSTLTNAWRMRGGIGYEFARGNPVIEPHGFVVLVGFDPATNTAALSAFLNEYRLPPGAAARIFGPFQGRLGNGGDEVLVDRPGEPIPDVQGLFVPRIRVDRLQYGTAGAWPMAADGAGMSLQRLDARAYGNDPVNWQAAWPTPGAANASAGGDADADGLPDAWEAAHGLNAFAASGNDGPNGDPDGDGMTNLQELQAGTDPREITIRIALFRREGASVRIRFNAAAGVSYRVEYADALRLPNWQTLGSYGPQATIGPAEQLYSLPAENATRFFRVVLNR